jgi:hypothetical protein
MLVRIHCPYGDFCVNADGTGSFMLPSAQPYADKWTSLPSFDKSQSYSASMQMYVPWVYFFILLALWFFGLTINYKNVWLQESSLICLLSGQRRWPFVGSVVFTGNLLCSHSTLSSQILLEMFTLHKLGSDRRHPRRSLISPYNNIHHLKCNINSRSLELNRDKKLECCKVLLHLSQSLPLLVKFYFIVITFVDSRPAHL